MAERPIRPSLEAAEAGGWLGKAALSLASLALVGLVVFGGELLSRLLAPDYLVRVRGLHVYSPVYGWAGRPGAVAPMGDGRVTLNRRGYRGREPSAKRGDATRVVVLGDSVAFGYGVADTQPFPQLLDARDNGLEVVNLAVAGYGPGQELLVLRREVLPLRPDVVVLAVCLRNDFVDAALPVALYDGVTPRPRFRLDGATLVLDDAAMPHSAFGRGIRRLTDSSHLFNRLLVLLRREGQQDPHDWRYRKREVLRDPDYALRLTVALVLEMDGFCRRNGFPLLVACFPSGLTYERNTGLPARFMTAVRDEGVWTVDMSTRFREAGLTSDEGTLDRTGHLSVRGHELSSDVLQQEIVAGLARHRTGEAAAR